MLHRCDKTKKGKPMTKTFASLLSSNKAEIVVTKLAIDLLLRGKVTCNFDTEPFTIIARKSDKTLLDPKNKNRDRIARALNKTLGSDFINENNFDNNNLFTITLTSDQLTRLGNSASAEVIFTYNFEQSGNTYSKKPREQVKEEAEKSTTPAALNLSAALAILNINGAGGGGAAAHTAGAADQDEATTPTSRPTTPTDTRSPTPCTTPHSAVYTDTIGQSRGDAALPSRT